ncbi:arginyl-tRNA synthetase [Nitrosomonas marina]|uniref:Arginine--tRNA ligase n=1 Tax=Nitrosomonas marina TaxID=917 RepID=A0A1I0FNL1_9PROT|nr:arginine--tRNA ligase [Nitrosomonas marina]SET59708.1 arginyl-tRNA synthetase [Nitrosomonas marina]
MDTAAPPNFKDHLSQLMFHAVEQIRTDSGIQSGIEIVRTRQTDHGDYSCNLAMQLAKPLRKNPREIAALLIAALPPSPYLEKVEVAGAGFINFFIKTAAKQACLYNILQRSTAYGTSDYGKKREIQVEFVSANPTGPLHVGHGRGAAFGASLANVLSAAGFTVTREYYVNDAGRQMDILAVSTWLRYLELNNIHIPFPDNAYQGDYVKVMARLIYEAHADRYVHHPEKLLQGFPASTYEKAIDTDELLDRLIANARAILDQDYAYIHNFVLTEQLGDCRNDLMEFGVTFDTWFSEQSLFDNGLVAHAVRELEEKKFLYRQDGAVWFRSTEFGDEKDRVVQRENGQYTYFASDIAYHLNKFERGFETIINVWGADHHGYIPRVKAALQALALDADKLNIALVQFAVLYRNGKKASMSTRSGEFVTLRELRQEVGNDAARFFYVMRKSDQHLDFDLDLAKSQSNDNPVFYIQYAHARICSVLEQWGGDTATLTNVDTNLLANASELALLQRLIDFPDIIIAAAEEFSPHLIAFYLRELASEFHSYYNSTHFLVTNIPLMEARLVLITAIRQVLRNGLALLGVSAPEKM